MTLKDLTGTLGSDGEGAVGDFPPPSAAEWDKINAGATAREDLPNEPEEEPAEQAETEQADTGATGQAETEAPAEDPDIALPDGTSMKLSEIVRLRALQTTAKPITTPAAQPPADMAAQRAALEQEREAFKRLQEQHRAGIAEILKDPAKYRELQQQAGINTDPHPVRDAQKWVQHRYNQYLQVGWKPEEVTREKLLADLNQAQTVTNARELEVLRSKLDEQHREVEDQKHFASVTKELEGLFARPELAYAATPEGRDMVDALLAQADRDGRDVDLQDVVRQVHEFGARLIGSYVQKKTGQAKATAPLLRGGGSHRAPEPKDYGSGYGGFNQIARDRMKAGG